jgi:lipoprotein-anchoring transpeptidase ErfK/SrfK
MAVWVEPKAVPKTNYSVAAIQKPVVRKTKAVVAQTVPEALPIYYGQGLCTNASMQYECVKVEKSQSWESMFPDETQRDLVQRVNRNYNYLWQGKVIAVPRDLAHVTVFDLSPFPLKIQGVNEKIIIVDQDKLAWAAYDAQGQMVKWGPIASGRDKCPDSARACRTLTGMYRVFSKENEKCKSDVFPIGKGGAPMPYCMYFHKGFALHGSSDMPGYRASHGCVRMFTRDAKWLNETFVEATSERNNTMGTLVVVRPVIPAGAAL